MNATKTGLAKSWRTFSRNMASSKIYPSFPLTSRKFGIVSDPKMTSVTNVTYPETPDKIWTVAEAKAKFSEVIERARTDAPQAVTRNGQPAVVVVSAEEWERKTKRRGTLADFLSNSPLKGVNLDVRRPKESPRASPL